MIPLLSVHHFHFETINYNMHSVRAFFPMVFFHSSIESISIGSLTCQPEEIMPILTSFSFTDQTLSTKFHHEQGPFCLKLESFCNWNTFLVLVLVPYMKSLLQPPKREFESSVHVVVAFSKFRSEAEPGQVWSVHPSVRVWGRFGLKFQFPADMHG